MTPFTYTRPESVPQALRSGAGHQSDTKSSTLDFFAGGTDMMQLMHERVRNPEHVVDITALPQLDMIEVGERSTRLGALVRMSDAAAHPHIVEIFPVVAEALLASASPQVRNLATLGGNLLQRTRCGYFRDVVTPCNKRVPGSGCPAIDGQNRGLAILGTSQRCIATYAGDFANALMVLEANVHIAGSAGIRTVALADLHRQPGETPHLETHLQPGDLIVAIEIPQPARGLKSHYLKVRDRTSFAFALASVAVALEMAADGTVREVRIAVGGVATTPWRLPLVEQVLRGRKLDKELCRKASALASADAVSHGQNAFKSTLLERVVARGLEETGGLG